MAETNSENSEKRKNPDIGTNLWQLRFRQFSKKKTAVASIIFLLGMIMIATLAPYVAPHEYTTMHGGRRLEPPSREFLLGTDNLGRCIFSRLVFGARISLSIGLIAIGIACFFGIIFGLMAGYMEGLIDDIIMRSVDILLAFPAILLALVIVAILGTSLYNLMIAVGIAQIPQYTRLVRGTTLSAKEDVYVEATQAMGAGTSRILFKHILPNILAPIIVMATLGVAGAILVAASLGFIGLGAPPPTPEWGTMLSASRNFIARAPWMFAFPGLAITSVVLAINIAGDALRDVLDPKLIQR